MWCLETIVALNEAASKRAELDQSISLAYSDVGINSTNSSSSVEERCCQRSKKAK